MPLLLQQVSDKYQMTMDEPRVQLKEEALTCDCLFHAFHNSLFDRHSQNTTIQEEVLPLENFPLKLVIEARWANCAWVIQNTSRGIDGAVLGIGCHLAISASDYTSILF